MRDCIRLQSPVRRITRHREGVAIETFHGKLERLDAIVIATPGDRALDLLSDRSDAEGEVLSAIRYKSYRVVLHRDHTVLVRLRSYDATFACRHWASTETQQSDQQKNEMHMRIEVIDSAGAGLVLSFMPIQTIDPATVVDDYVFRHPILTVGWERAQRRRDEINGACRTYYCGAYWGNALHEDAIRSALDVVQRLQRCP